MKNGALLPLRLHGVSFTAGGRAIIDGITLEIEAGRSTVILGANGAGKSVLMRLMHGLLSPTSGRVEWSAPEGRPRKQAMVFQRPVMLRRSASANMAYALAQADVPRKARAARIAELLDRVGLAELAHRPARHLSSGEQQRLALARALARNPELLLLDEPTASLDPAATRGVEEIIAAAAQSGIKVVMASHDLGQVRRLAGEVIFLLRGRVHEREMAHAFFDSPATAEAASFLRGDLVI